MCERYLLFLILCAATAFPAAADTVPRSGGADQAALLQSQALAQQAAAERDTLREENAKLTKELESVKKEAARLRADKTNSEKILEEKENTLSRFKEANSQAVDRVRETQDRLEKLVEKYKELVAELKGLETEKAKLQDTVSTQSSQLDDCAKHNVALYQVDLELLDQYRRKGMWDAFKQREPVTGLGQIAVENMIEQYRLRLDKDKVNDATVAK